MKLAADYHSVVTAASFLAIQQVFQRNNSDSNGIRFSSDSRVASVNATDGIYSDTEIVPSIL